MDAFTVSDPKAKGGKAAPPPKAAVPDKKKAGSASSAPASTDVGSEEPSDNIDDAMEAALAALRVASRYREDGAGW